MPDGWTRFPIFANCANKIYIRFDEKLTRHDFALIPGLLHTFAGLKLLEPTAEQDFSMTGTPNISRGADKPELDISSHRTAVSAENKPFADKVFPLG